MNLFKKTNSDRKIKPSPTKPCPKCNGTGWGVDAINCEYCGGTGKVPARQCEYC